VGGPPLSGGYRYLRAAVDAGAAAVVLQAGEAPVGIPVVHVPDARAALADLSGDFYGHPSHDLHLFAVTGTDGKTTTAYLLEQVLAFTGFQTGLLGTVEVKIGPERLANVDRMTTPESLEVQRLLRRMADAGVTHVTLEASSHALALDRLRGCRFTAAAITNITADHLEFHGSWEAYFAAKSRLFTELAAGKPAVLNRDIEQFDRLAALASGRIVSYGLAAHADLQAEILSAGPRSTAARLRFQGQEALTNIPLPGRFNVSNALAAAGLALATGLDLHLVADGISAAEGPPGRLQAVTQDAPFEVLVDYAHTPNAFRSVLSALREGLNGGRLIAVFGAAGNRDHQKRPELARIARSCTDFFYITNEDPFGEDPEAIMDEIEAGAPSEEMGKRYARVPDRAEAIRQAIARARPGDVIVLLGKGHERSIAAGDRNEPWSDVEKARSVLEQLR
jgi:UDP-N-acetylmuramoyl-L-alanyl-D-glutamate--2,6-diaminopimelate ligase